MGNPRVKSALRTAVGLVIAWALTTPLYYLGESFNRLAEPWWSGDHSLASFLRSRLADALKTSLHDSYVVALTLATVAIPLAFAVRTLVRGHVRAGNTDPFARMRRWMEGHPKGSLAVSAIVPSALVWLETMVYFGHSNSALTRYFQGGSVVEQLMAGGVWAVPAALALTAMTLAARTGLRAFVSPTVDPSEMPKEDVSRDEIAFDAVAVTFETRAAVVGMALLPFGLVALVNALDLHKRGGGTLEGVAIVAYVAIALGGAFLFQRASRIAVGLDGVYVTGTSRTRFFAYRDLDGARVTRGNLELVKGTRAVLCLQLHGEDAGRRQAVLERIQTAVAQAKVDRSDVTTDYVASASSEALTRAAQGARDYRAAAVSREQLWAIVEGPAIDGAARRTAAGALASNADADERARLRVAAEHCADPKVRVAIQKLVEPGDDGDDGNEVDAEPAPPLAQARRT